jgi:hypothetical protein
MSGYMHVDYAQSLAEFGTPRELFRSGGWVLERQIPGFSSRDAMGCYPLFACRDWSQLHADLDDIGTRWVSLSMVTDPFGEYDPAVLRKCFGDVVIPFKEHFIVDLHRPAGDVAGTRHRKHARRALRQIRVEVSPDATQLVDEWCALYDSLIQRHNVTGIRAFSKKAFAKQLSIPGTVVMWARYQDVIVGAQIYLVQGDVIYCHLGASNRLGYELGAFYALDWFSIEYFHNKARWLDLGGGAGATRSKTDGLSQYKRGWSTETRMAYFCGRIFNPQRYAEIVQAKGVVAVDYFPAYRNGEFG